MDARYFIERQKAGSLGSLAGIADNVSGLARQADQRIKQEKQQHELFKEQLWVYEEQEKEQQRLIEEQQAQAVFNAALDEISTYAQMAYEEFETQAMRDPKMANEFVSKGLEHAPMLKEFTESVWSHIETEYADNPETLEKLKNDFFPNFVDSLKVPYNRRAITSREATLNRNIEGKSEVLINNPNLTIDQSVGQMRGHLDSVAVGWSEERKNEFLQMFENEVRPLRASQEMKRELDSRDHPDFDLQKTLTEIKNNFGLSPQEASFLGQQAIEYWQELDKQYEQQISSFIDHHVNAAYQVFDDGGRYSVEELENQRDKSPVEFSYKFHQAINKINSLNDRQIDGVIKNHIDHGRRLDAHGWELISEVTNPSMRHDLEVMGLEKVARQLYDHNDSLEGVLSYIDSSEWGSSRAKREARAKIFSYASSQDRSNNQLFDDTMREITIMLDEASHGISTSTSQTIDNAILGVETALSQYAGDIDARIDEVSSIRGVSQEEARAIINQEVTAQSEGIAGLLNSLIAGSDQEEITQAEVREVLESGSAEEIQDLAILVSLAQNVTGEVLIEGDVLEPEPEKDDPIHPSRKLQGDRSEPLPESQPPKPEPEVSEPTKAETVRDGVFNRARTNLLPISPDMQQQDIVKNMVANVLRYGRDGLPVQNQTSLLSEERREEVNELLLRIATGEPGVDDLYTVSVVQGMRGRGIHPDALKDISYYFWEAGLLTEEKAHELSQLNPFQNNPLWKRLDSALAESGVGGETFSRIQELAIDKLTMQPELLEDRTLFNKFIDDMMSTASEHMAYQQIRAFEKAGKGLEGSWFTRIGGNDALDALTGGLLGKDAFDFLTNKHYVEFNKAIKNNELNFVLDFDNLEAASMAWGISDTQKGFNEYRTELSQKMFGRDYDDLPEWKMSVVTANSAFAFSSERYKQAFEGTFGWNVVPHLDRQNKRWVFRDKEHPNIFYAPGNVDVLTGNQADGLQWSMFRVPRSQGVYDFKSQGDPIMLSQSLPVDLYSNLQELKPRAMEAEVYLERLEGLKGRSRAPLGLLGVSAMQDTSLEGYRNQIRAYEAAQKQFDDFMKALEANREKLLGQDFYNLEGMR